MNKKLLSYMLVLLLMLAFSGTSVFAAEATLTDADEIDAMSAGWPFKDVRQSDSGANEMLRAYNYGMMKGFGDYNSSGQQSFKPKKNVTRAQFAIALYNLAKYLGYEVRNSYRNGFPDMSVYDNGCEEVGWCYSEGILTGFKDGRIKPNKEITRAQMCIMLFRFSAAYGYSVSGRSNINSYADVNSVSSDMQVRSPIRWALYSGLMYGINKNGRSYIYPSKGTSRAQCAMMLIRFMDKKTTAYNQRISRQQADNAIRKYIQYSNWRNNAYNGITSEDNYTYNATIRLSNGTMGEIHVAKVSGLGIVNYY